MRTLMRRIAEAGRGRGGPGESRMLVAVGAAGIAAVLAVLVVMVALPRGWYLVRTDSYTAELANAAGLREGDPVLVAGVPTGKVESVEFAGDHVDVGFRLDDGQRLGSATTAGVRLQTILGKRYLNVAPAGDGGLGPDRTIPLERTTVPYSLDATAGAAVDTADGLDADAIAEAVRALTEALPGGSGEFRRAVSGVSAAARAMADDGDRVDHLLTATQSLAGLVARQSSAIDSASADARTLLTSLAARRAQVSGLADDLRTVLDASDSVLDVADGAGGGGLDELVANLHSVLGTLADEEDRIDAILTKLPATVRYVVDASGNGSWIDVSAPAGPIPDTLLCMIGVMEGCS